VTTSTPAAAADRLHGHLTRRRSASRLDLRGLIASLSAYHPRAKAGHVVVRGRMEWSSVLRGESETVVTALLKDLWNHTARHLATDAAVRRQQFRVPSITRGRVDAAPSRAASYAATRAMTTQPNPGPDPKVNLQGASVAQWQLVIKTIADFFGTSGGPAMTTKRLEDLPPLRIVWDSPDIPEDANACCIERASGRLEIGLRTSSANDDLRRSVIHELQHAVDMPLANALTREEFERRAEVVAALHGPRDAVRRHHHAMGWRAQEETEDMEQQRDHIHSVRAHTRHFLSTRYARTQFRLSPDHPWRSGADFAQHLDDLSDDDVRLLADDCLGDIEENVLTR
jgi:hypothetical protein